MSSDTWLYEIAAVTFSGLCFAATIITIAVHNGKPSPQLSYGLTLNTIVSILTTASKSSLAYFVSGAIGQLKWLWVRGVRRPVDDLKSFDDASRGPFGSIIILFRHKGLSLVSLGAAITDLSLVFDPFMQQIVSYPVYQTPMKSSQATAKQTVNFLGSGFTSADPAWEFIPFGVKAAVNAALWSDGFEMEPTCPTGNCTWPSFTSVGWCNQCKDVTSQATLVGCDDLGLNNTGTNYQFPSCEIALPGGQRSKINIKYIPAEAIRIDQYDPNLEILQDIISALYPPYEFEEGKKVPPTNGTFAGLHDPLMAIAHTTLSFYPNISLAEKGLKLSVKKSTQCALTICARTYNLSFNNGILSTNATVDYGRFYQRIMDTTEDPDYQLWYPAWKPNKNATAHGNYIFKGEIMDGISDEHLGQTYWDIHKGPLVKSSDGVQQVMTLGLETILTRIAASLTKFGRVQNNTVDVNGTVFHSEVYVAVDWRWISLPAILIAAAIIFLIAAIVVNHIVWFSVWKSSVLSLLYHSLEENMIPGSEQDTTRVSQIEPYRRFNER